VTNLQQNNVLEKELLWGWQLFDERPEAFGDAAIAEPHASPAPDSLIETLKQELLTAGHVRQQREAASQLRQQGVQAVAALIDVIREGEEAAQVLAAYSLCGIGRVAVDSLVAAVLYDVPVVRQKAIWVLYTIGGSLAVEPLINALQDEYAKTRRYAVWALGYLQAAEAIPYLVEALNDPHDKVRFDAGVALVKIGGEAVVALLDALYYGSVRARMQAAAALAWLKDERALAALTEALGDPNSEVRVQAAFALGWIGDKQAVEPLLDTLEDEAAEVRMQAAAALGWIGDPRAIEGLIGLVHDEDEWVIYSAVEALTTVGDARAIAPLMMVSLGAVFRVREAARSALQQLGYHAMN
jgi:HEAT repeat protein